MILPSGPRFRLTAALLALSMGGCSQYSTVTEKRPTYPSHPLTPVGAIIVQALETGSKKPERRLGACLDAAAAASAILQAHPNDFAAQRDYNFAVGRIFEILHESRLSPWEKPLTVPGAGGPWELRGIADKKSKADPAHFALLPTDRYQFKGSYITRRTSKPGIGAPLVAIGDQFDYTKVDRFAQGKHIYYGITSLITFQGRKASIVYYDPLAVEKVRFAGATFPLAADYSAPLDLALARENPRKLELARLLRPQHFAESARLARLQPYEPQKIPVICVHGLMDSAATWVPMINTLRADPEIRSRYQFWFYNYPSGYPYPHSAAIMRRELDAIDAAYPGHKPAVLIGHSMGGIISRTLLTDSGMTLWNANFSKPPEKTGLSSTTRKTLTDALIFRHRPNLARVIFIASPHRGSEMSTSWVGRLGSRLVQGPSNLLKVAQEARGLLTLDTSAMNLDRMPNSIDTLSPTNRFVRAINTLPLTPGVPFHSIMGDRGMGGNKDRTAPVSSDGIVPYWSSHLEGAQSELIVPSSHSAHQNAQAIEEVRRILRLHVGK